MAPPTTLVHLITSWYQEKVPRLPLTITFQLKKSNAKYLTSKATYGWNRMEVLGSMISLVFLASLCFGTAIEALQVNLKFSKNVSLNYNFLLSWSNLYWKIFDPYFPKEINWNSKSQYSQILKCSGLISLSMWIYIKVVIVMRISKFSNT